jgi:hypothetical protein
MRWQCSKMHRDGRSLPFARPKPLRSVYTSEDGDVQRLFAAADEQSISSRPASAGIGSVREEGERAWQSSVENKRRRPYRDAGEHPRRGWLVSYLTRSLRRKLVWSAATHGLVMGWISRWIGLERSSPGPEGEAGGQIWRSTTKLIGRREQSQWAGTVGLQICEGCCQKLRREKISFDDLLVASGGEAQTAILRLRLFRLRAWPRHHATRNPQHRLRKTNKQAVASEAAARPPQTAVSAPRQLLFPIFLIGPAACSLHADRSVCSKSPPFPA